MRRLTHLLCGLICVAAGVVLGVRCVDLSPPTLGAIRLPGCHLRWLLFPSDGTGTVRSAATAHCLPDV